MLAALLGVSQGCVEAPSYLPPPPGSFSAVSVRLKAPGDSQPASIAAARVTNAFFPIVTGPSADRGVLITDQVKAAPPGGRRPLPLIGRYFVAGEFAEQGTPVAVISHALWNSRFRSDVAVIGSTVEVDGTPTFIIGVGPPGYAPPGAGDFWLPVMKTP